MIKNKHRVAICKHTGKEIVQLKEDSGNWLCLHRETELLDKVSVDSFKAGHGA